MRQRLSWDEQKVAEMAKKADPYDMNQDHKNNPVEKYHTGDPSTWAEDPNMKTPWKTEGRTETGHPAPSSAREAVTAARKMEDKALKCITIAQRILPGASDTMIEDQATDLMYMPERCIMATLQRQASLAEALAKTDEVPPVEDKKEEKKEEPVVEAKKEEKKEEEIELQANDMDLLDSIFAADEPKTGAKKLSGIVKQASDSNRLDSLWDAPPDVSKLFK